MTSVAPYVADVFAAGYAVHGPDTVSESAIAAFTLAVEMASDRHDPNILMLVAEIAKYEGMMATLAERREALSKRWERKIKPIPKAIAANIDTAAFITAAHRHLADHNLGPDRNDDEPLARQRASVAKGAALVALTGFLKANPEIASQWTELVAQAEAEAKAEGVVQATALSHEKAGLPPSEMPDLDDLYAKTLKALRELDSYGNRAPAWIRDQLDGLAGDMGKAIADGIVRNFGPTDLLEYVNKIIDKGLGAQRYIDESIHFAMQQAAVAQMAAQGVEFFDYVAMPDACPICAPLDSSIAGPYTEASLPSPPQHIGCRCLVTDGGTVSDPGGNA